MKISLRFSDPEAAGELAAASPCPDQVIVWGPTDRIEASEPAQIFSEIVLEFGVGVTSSLLAQWIVYAVRKRNRDSTRINRKEIPLTKEAVQRLIEDEIAKRSIRKAQESEPHAKA